MLFCGTGAFQAPFHSCLEANPPLLEQLHTATKSAQHKANLRMEFIEAQNNSAPKHQARRFFTQSVDRCITPAKITTVSDQFWLLASH